MRMEEKMKKIEPFEYLEPDQCESTIFWGNRIAQKINELVEAVNVLMGNCQPNEQICIVGTHASCCECKFCKPKPSTLASRLAPILWSKDFDTEQVVAEAKRFFKEVVEEQSYKNPSGNDYLFKHELLRRIEEA
jgi:hypothetical protein